MGIAGAGYGAAKTLEQLVMERRLQQALTAEIENRNRALTEQNRSNVAEEGLRGRALDQQQQATTAAADDRDADRRQRSNEQGLRTMGADFIRQKQGDLTPDDLRGLAAMQAEAGREIDPRLLVPPPTPKVGTHVVGGNLVDDSGKVLFKAPPDAGGGSSDQVWVVRDGKPTPIPKGSARPGDTPYDPVSNRQQASAGAATPYSVERATRTVAAVDELMGKVGMSTAGFGSLLAGIPATSARNFKSELDTLKSNIAFNELAQMREASKTGGALGQVSDREAQLLSSTLGALDAGQSPSDLKSNLQQIKDSVQRWQQAHGAAEAPSPVPSHGPAIGEERTINGVAAKWDGKGWLPK